MRGKGETIRRIVGSRMLQTTITVCFILNTVILSCFAMSVMYFRENHFYTNDGKKLQDNVINRLMDESDRDALEYLECYLRSEETDSGSKDDSIKKELDDKKHEYSQLFANSNYEFVFTLDNKSLSPKYSTPNETDRNYTRSLDNLRKHTGKAALALSELEKKADHLDFQAYVKDALSDTNSPHDQYWHAFRFFSLSNKLKYVVFALMILFAVFECVLAGMVYSTAGQTALMRRRDLDQIPMYFLAPFCALLCWLCILFLHQQTDVLSDLSRVFSDLAILKLGLKREPTMNITQTVYSFFLLLFVPAALLYILVSTIGVRLHRPMWWRRSILYRTFAGRTFGQRARMILSIVVTLQAAVYFAFLMRAYKNWWFYFLPDAVFVVTMTVLLYIVYKDMSIYIPQTHRIAAEQVGSVPTDGLSDSGRKHAENINYLSRNAGTETEKRFINENFSTELIHSVSEGLSGPLKEVAENIRLLESGTLSDEQSRQSIAHIVSLSQDLKKTIEDLILISKASTGNIPIDPVPTDVGMMVSQAIGEFYPRFEEAGVEPVTEQPDEPVRICADGQYMWYVFEGVLSVMLENAVSGTRLFMRAGREGENAVILFRCTVRADARQQLRELSGMGIASAKVFAMLQGGSLVDHLSHDTLMVVLQFPAIASDESE